MKPLPGGATVQLCRRIWLVESRHVTYDVTPPHLHITWPIYGGCHLVLLLCCFAMIRSPGGAATSQICRRFSLVESSHVTYDVTPLHLHITWPLYGGCHLVLRWYDRQRALARFQVNLGDTISWVECMHVTWFLAHAQHAHRLSDRARFCFRLRERLLIHLLRTSQPYSVDDLYITMAESLQSIMWYP